MRHELLKAGPTWWVVEKGERLGAQIEGAMLASVMVRWELYYDMRDVLRDSDG